MKKTIERLEGLVRDGQFDEAEKQVRGLRKFERQNAVTLANIAQRINRPHLAIKILNPIIRPKNHRQESPSPSEKVEYAEALRRIGAFDESWQLLNEVPEDQFSQVSRYKAFCLISQWKYDEALPHLRNYLNRDDLEVYTRHIGQINLAAALIQLGELQEAQDLLQKLRPESKNLGFTLLYGNNLELSAQILILQKDFDGALAVLGQSKELLKSSGKIFTLFVEKWTAIAESLKKNLCTPMLYETLAKAKIAQHWESVRDCELYIALLNQDRPRLEHLYFSTPFKFFRQRILNFAGPNFQLSKTYTWSASRSPQSRFNLASGKVQGNVTAALPIGQSMHRFMILLCQDLYRPLSASGAFGKLFPQEFMNTETSINRVHQIVKRCRKWINEFKLDLQIEESEGGYRLIAGEKIGIVLPLEPLPLQTTELEWLLLEMHFGNRSFDIHEAKAILSSSDSKVHRLLRWAFEQGCLKKIGKGAGTFYQVVNELNSNDSSLRGYLSS